MSASTSKNAYQGAVAASDLFGVHDFDFRGNIYFVDGTNGDDNNTGLDTFANAKATIQAAITAASAGDTVVVAPKLMAAGDTDPNSYAETLTIAAAKSNLRLVGVSRGRTQGGLPQIKPGSGTTAALTVRAPGCLIENLGFNGIRSIGSTQSLVGILLDDDSSTKTAFGTTIRNCHFKNCAGANSSTNAAQGGAISWSANGAAWQTHIQGCRFYKNVGDIVLIGTGVDVVQDVIVEDCIFSGPAANMDCNIYAALDGFNGIAIRNCSFQQKPAMGGTNSKYIVLATGTVGVISGCTFGCQTNTTGGTRITFKSGGTGGDFPVTVHIVNSYGQSITASETGEINIS